MDIYDCFMYFDEDLLLDIRLNSLDKFVKKFVISEATYTHNGNKKNLKFDINKFKKFKDKIIYIAVDEQPENILDLVDGESKNKRGEKLILNGMARDYFQRQNLIKGLQKTSDEDLIMISDLDEIPNLDNLDASQIKNNIVIFEQKMYYYKFNLLYENFIWHGSKAIKKKYFISPQWLRNIKSKRYSKLRLDIFFSKKKYSNLHFVKDGGWHFSCIKNPDELEQKLKNFAHHYEFEESGLTKDDLERMIKDNLAVYDYHVDMKKNKWKGEKKLKITDNIYLPKYVQDNLDKYKGWLA